MKPKKLIRSKIPGKLKEGEWERITDIDELNKLYILKIKEELEEIQNSDYKDISEFVDLIQVASSFAKVNGFDKNQITNEVINKSVEKGVFNDLVLNKLNPHNPSNRIYFSNQQA